MFQSNKDLSIGKPELRGVLDRALGWLFFLGVLGGLIHIGNDWPHALKYFAIATLAFLVAPRRKALVLGTIAFASLRGLIGFMLTGQLVLLAFTAASGLLLILAVRWCEARKPLEGKASAVDYSMKPTVLFLDVAILILIVWFLIRIG